MSVVEEFHTYCTKIKLKLFYIIFLIVLVSCSSKHKADSSILYPYWDKGDFMSFKYKYRAGYIDLSGNRVIDNKFVAADPFTNGLGCVAIDTDSGVFSGYIDSSANFVIKPIFKRARAFQNDRAWVLDKENDKWGVINKKAEFITEKIFDITTDYNKGYCIAYIKQGTIAPTRFENTVTRIFTLGLFDAPDKIFYNCYKIDINGKVTLIDTCITSPKYGYARRQNNLGIFWYPGRDHKYGFKRIKDQDFDSFFNTYNHDKGTVWIKPVYKSVSNFEYGYALVTFENEEQGYIDTNGVVIVRFKQDRPY